MTLAMQAKSESNHHAIASWVHKGFFTLVDQGMISGSNFVVAVLLARWLTPEEYGAYAIGMSLFVLMANIHQALVLEPFTVLHDEGTANEAANVVFWSNKLLCALFAVLLAAAGLCFSIAGHGPIASTLPGLAIAATCTFSFFLFRAACYLNQTPRLAASVSGVYSGVLIGGVLIAHHFSELSPFLAFLIMAIGSMAAAVVLGYSLHWRLGPPAFDREAFNLLRRHWDYGRWALATALVMWIHISGFTPIIGVLLGVREAGALAAAMNILLPIGSVLNAMGRLCLPYLSRVFSQDGPESLKRKMQIFVSLVFSGTTAYAVAVTLLRERLFNLLYGGKFDAFTYLVPGLLLSAVLSMTAAATDVGLRAVRSPSSAFMVNSLGATISLLFGWSATYFLGLSGTVASLVCSGAVALAVSIYLLQRRLTPPHVWRKEMSQV